MTPVVIWTIQFVLTASMVILATAVLIHVRRIRERLGDIDPDSIKGRLAELERKALETESELATRAREAAEISGRLDGLKGELDELREESARFLNVFKTVLYGFDYIVQGCKTALEIKGADQRPPEKRITTEETKDAPPE